MILTEIQGPEGLELESGNKTLKRLYGYWAARRGAKRYPSRDDIDPIDFGYALGHVSLIEAMQNPPRFRYRLVSGSLTARLGYEMTGKFLDEVPESEMRAYTARIYAMALAKGVPLHLRDQVTLDGRRWNYEALILPLSSDGYTVDILMIYRLADRPTPSSPISVQAEPE